MANIYGFTWNGSTSTKELSTSPERQMLSLSMMKQG
jgi:hypothetical protein